MIVLHDSEIYYMLSFMSNKLYSSSCHSKISIFLNKKRWFSSLDFMEHLPFSQARSIEKNHEHPIYAFALINGFSLLDAYDYFMQKHCEAKIVPS